MTKQAYMEPSVKVEEFQYKCQILAGSVDQYGINDRLQDEEEDVEEGW